MAHNHVKDWPQRTIGRLLGTKTSKCFFKSVNALGRMCAPSTCLHSESSIPPPSARKCLRPRARALPPFSPVKSPADSLVNGSGCWPVESVSMSCAPKPPSDTPKTWRQLHSIYTCILTHTHTYMHTYICSYMRTYVHTYMNI